MPRISPSRISIPLGGRGLGAGTGPVSTDQAARLIRQHEQALRDLDTGLPSFVVYKKGTQSVSASTNTKITYQVALSHLNEDVYDTSSHELVNRSSRSALWLIGATVLCSNMTAGTSVIVRVASTPGIALAQQQGSAATGQNVFDVVTLAKLASGARRYVEVYHNDAAGARDFGDSADTTSFWGVQLMSL